jgi:hypothetical protein
MPSAKQRNCKHVYKSVPEVYRGQWRSFAVSNSWEAVSQGHEAVTEESREDSAAKL